MTRRSKVVPTAAAALPAAAMDNPQCNVALQMALELVRSDDELGRLFASVCSPAFPPATMEALVHKLRVQLLRHWREPGGLDRVFARFVAPTHYTLPDPPVSADARLFALAPDDAVDRLSGLPDALLGNIVSRLPVKDAARTSALSRRWRGVWRSTPLVLHDADLDHITSAVSRVLAEHPGPFRRVHFSSSKMEDFHGLLTSWLQILADKGIQELLLVNGQSPHDHVLPSTFLGMATLTRLYLGLWKFPDTAAAPPTSFFPNLRDLCLCGVLMENSDLDFILDRSPVLETLCVEGNQFKLRLRLVSQSLRCVQFIGSFFEEIAVVHAPCLERLIHSGGWTSNGVCTKVKIGHAPKLHLFGYFDAGNNVLEIGDTVIKAETKACPSTIVTSVRILALEFRCGVSNDVKMIPTILRCFPNVETLHIMSRETGKTSGKLKVNPKFWNECGTIDGIRSCIKMLVFNDYRGDRSELAFLKFFLGSALVLERVAIAFADLTFASREDLNNKVMPLRSMKRASADCKTKVTGRSNPEGGIISSFKRTSDFSRVDPL